MCTQSHSGTITGFMRISKLLRKCWNGQQITEFVGGPEIISVACKGRCEREVGDLSLTVEIERTGEPEQVRNSRLFTDVHEPNARFIGFVSEQVFRLARSRLAIKRVEGAPVSEEHVELAVQVGRQQRVGIRDRFGELADLAAGHLVGLGGGVLPAEVVRVAVQSIPKGQVEAGIALNFTPWQRRRRIVIPQALILMLPAFGNNIIEMLKASALVGLIGLTDLTRQSQLIRSNLGRTGDVFLLVLLLFFLISTLFLTVTRYLERRFSRGMDMGMAARGIK
jgi:hypothetical protein